MWFYLLKGYSRLLDLFIILVFAILVFLRKICNRHRKCWKWWRNFITFLSDYPNLKMVAILLNSEDTILNYYSIIETNSLIQLHQWCYKICVSRKSWNRRKIISAVMHSSLTTLKNLPQHSWHDDIDRHKEKFAKQCLISKNFTKNDIL